LLLVLFTLPGFALAGEPQPAGVSLFREGEYEAAAAALSEALEAPGLQKDEEVELLGWLGAAYQMAGDGTRSMEAWERRVRLAPEAALPPGVPMLMKALYEDVQALMVRLVHRPQATAAAGQSLLIEAALSDARGRVTDVLLYHRLRGARRFQATALERSEPAPGVGAPSRWRFELELPPVAGRTQSLTLQYYLVALSAQGELLDQVGEASQPLDVALIPSAADPLAAGVPVGTEDLSAAPPPAPEEHAEALRPAPPPREQAIEAGGGVPGWVWVAGAVVLTAGVGAGVLLVPGPTPPTTLGSIRYPLEVR